MPLLTGLTADGVEVPVQVEPDGVLVAEGIQGPPGAQGPKGDTGPQGPKGDPAGGGVVGAWASVRPNGTLQESYNIASVNRTETGFYELVFANPMQSTTYAAIGSTNSVSTGQTRTATVIQRTTTGFTVRTKNATAYEDYEFSVAIFTLAGNSGG